jgi:hypothetical protein
MLKTRERFRYLCNISIALLIVNKIKSYKNFIHLLSLVTLVLCRPIIAQCFDSLRNFLLPINWMDAKETILVLASHTLSLKKLLNKVENVM